MTLSVLYIIYFLHVSFSSMIGVRFIYIFCSRGLAADSTYFLNDVTIFLIFTILMIVLDNNTYKRM